MFTISHSADGSFRLDIHTAPEEMDPDDARLLRAVLRALADQIPEGIGDGVPPDPEPARVGVGESSRAAGR